MDKNKVFKIHVNPDDETGVDFNSFVDVPAHLKGFIAFGKGAEHYSFNDEKRMVTGVMISVGTLIERFSKDLGQHWVVFDAPTVDIIRKKFFANGYNQNLNKDHDPNKITKGAILIDSYIIHSTDPKLPQAPEAFKNMNLQDGTWIATYHVTDDQLWDDVKSGRFNGFSVEGWFEKHEVKIKTNINMSKQKKSIWDLFKTNTPKSSEKFGTATTADGVAVSYEGDLVEGVALLAEVDGTQVPAPEGEHQLTLEDGSTKIVTVDENGLITSVADFTPEEGEGEEEMNDIRQEVADAMTNLAKEVHARFDAIEKENAELKAENESFKAEIQAIKGSDKFGSNPNKGAGQEEKKLTIAEMVAKKK